MKKSIFYRIAFFSVMALSSTAFVSCDKDDDEEVEILLPIAGDYTGSETCEAAGGVPSSEYDMHIYNSANDKNTIWVENAYGLGEVLKATWDGGNGFTLPSQEVSVVSGGVTYTGNISGTGKVENNELTFDFVTTDDLEDKCTFKGKREVILPGIGS